MNLCVLDAEPLGEDIVKVLENVLERARAGELSSVAVASVFRDGHVANSWSTPPNTSLLIGSVARLQAALIRAVDE